VESRYAVNSFRKDIRIKPYILGNLNILRTIHKTDPVSVLVGCSSSPIAVDVSGISNALTIEARLSKLIEECSRLTEKQDGLRVPDHIAVDCHNVALWCRRTY
jgi:hypothetical protein